jgi:hypothetical protein
MHTEALLKRETKAQESGNKLAAIHRLLPVVVPLTAQSHPDPSKWNCGPNAMASCPGPSTDFYGSLPLSRHGHRCHPRLILARSDQDASLT